VETERGLSQLVSVYFQSDTDVGYTRTDPGSQSQSLALGTRNETGTE